MESFYYKEMSELTAQYNSFIATAKNLNRRNGYVPTKEEYENYVRAMEVAKKLCNLNVQQRALYKQWSDRAAHCEKQAIEILKYLKPEAAAKPAAPEAAAPAGEAAVSAAQTVSGSGAVGEQQTASGFTTVNASEDVPAAMIEKWYQQKPDHGFDDIVGMQELKETIKEEILDNIGWDDTDELLGISKMKSYLFYGPFGTGKTFFIEAIAKELMEKGFKFIKLTGSDVHNTYVGVGEKVVRTAFQEAVDNAPCVLFFDEFENMCVERDGNNVQGHEKNLTVSFMESYNLIVNAHKPIVFLAATNYPDKIEHAMLSRILSYIPVPLPSEEVRSNYFAHKLKNIVLDEDCSPEYMADQTDNFSFRDLDKVSGKLKQNIKKIATATFIVTDESGKRLAKESDASVSDAIRTGKITLTKEIFDDVIRTTPPEKKSDILASLEAFEAKL